MTIESKVYQLPAAKHDAFRYEKEHVFAVQSIAEGRATPDQQRSFMDWLVRDACLHSHIAFNPGNERATAFVQGRQFVGTVMLELINNNGMRKVFDDGK
jgi:hypothetical protein